MAKKCKIAKDKQRAEIADRYAERRNALKAIIKNPESSSEQIDEAYVLLRRLPRDSNPIRGRNRCAHTGRPRGFIRKYGLSRISFREMVMRGFIPGVTKSSW